MAKYLVLQVFDYSSNPDSYIIAESRRAVAAQLIDFGWLDNPSVSVYRVPQGVEPKDYGYSLAGSIDPYPDWIVSRGPRGGIVWERA